MKNLASFVNRNGSLCFVQAVLVTGCLILASCASVPLSKHKADLASQQERYNTLELELEQAKSNLAQHGSKLELANSEINRLLAALEELRAVIAIKDAALVANASNLVQSNGIRIETLPHSILEEPRRSDRRVLRGTGLYWEWDVPNQSRYVHSQINDYKKAGLHAYLRSRADEAFRLGLQVQGSLSVKLDSVQLASGKQRIELELRNSVDQNLLMSAAASRFFTSTINVGADLAPRPAFRAVFEPDNNFMRLIASKEAQDLLLSITIVRFIHKPGQTASREPVATIFEGKLSAEEIQSCRLIYQTAADLGSLKLLQ